MVDEYIIKLKNEYKKNETQIRKNKAIIHELKLYDPEERIGRISLLSTLLYLPSFLGLFFLNIPSVVFPIATLLTSFGAGTFGTYLMERKAKCKERFKNVSKAKNESERIEEVLRLETEIEKLINRNEIINKVCQKHDNEIKEIKKFNYNDKYSIVMKKSNYNKTELLKRINELENNLKIKYEEIDNLTTASLLKNKYNANNDIMNTFFYTMICTSIPLVLSFLPVLTYHIRPLPNPSIFPLISTLVTGGLTFFGSLTHFYLKKKNTNKAIFSIKENKYEINKTNIENEIDRLKSQITDILLILNSYKNESNNYNLIEEYTKNKLSIQQYNTLDMGIDSSLEEGPKLTLK